MRQEIFDYWCRDCGVGFYSCTPEASDHDNDPETVGHRIYDGIVVTRGYENETPLYVG